ncbi:MAG: SAM-dependent DNA methyltransferase, partial [Veillonella sp.]|nr:SAM-dependent DNA methyltransferase [Veillonella sp.]
MERSVNGRISTGSLQKRIISLKTKVYGSNVTLTNQVGNAFSQLISAKLQIAGSRPYFAKVDCDKNTEENRISKKLPALKKEIVLENLSFSYGKKKVFENIFHTLDTGLSKLGDSSGTQTKAISGLLQLIKDIPMDGKQDYDVLGFIYEYLISMFAANAGKKAGEFYTPHEVSFLMSEIIANHLKNKKEIKIYDPTSGSGSLLINIGNSVAK